MKSLVQDVRVGLIAVWCGAALFFAAALAPVLFSVLPSRELAGLVVGGVLALLNYAGIIIGVLLLISETGGLAHEAKAWRRTELTGVIILILTCAVNEFFIGRRLANVRAQLNNVPLDELAIDNPLRTQFGMLHGWSVLVLGVGLLAGLAVLLATTRRGRLAMHG